MPIKLLAVMDPMQSIRVYDDTTFALLLSAQQRGWEIYYTEQQTLFLQDNKCFAELRSIEVFDDLTHWFAVKDTTIQSLSDMDIILMRKDPPVDINYIYTTYLLECAEKQGALIVNKPQSLRDANEKLFACRFSQCMVPTMVSANSVHLKKFIAEQQQVIVKPLDAMGGRSIFKLTANDPNINVVIETMTAHGKQLTMMQRFIPEIIQGDKRILLVDGEPIPYALARIPKSGEIRGNIAVGGSGIGVELTDRDRWICSQIGPTLKQMGLTFVGIDVIGNYLTEINVTSPTCVREIETHFKVDLCNPILDCLEKKLS